MTQQVPHPTTYDTWQDYPARLSLEQLRARFTAGLGKRGYTWVAVLRLAGGGQWRVYVQNPPGVTMSWDHKE
jgi:hypothetical protein